MKLNLNYYKEEQEKNVSQIEEEIIRNYINQYKEEDYEKIIESDNRIDVVLALCEIRRNIINWYPFKENSSILEIEGGLGEVTGELCKKCKKRVVTIQSNKKKAQAIAKRYENENNLEIIVGNIKDISFNEKFDYIFINGALEYAPLQIESKNPFIEFLNIVTNNLKDDAKLLIATDNKFGIRYWNGKKDLDGSFEYRNLGTRRDITMPQLFTKSKLEEMLKKIEMKHTKFYYIFPDYKMPNIIYSNEYEINKEDISRNFTCYEEREMVNFVENDVLREIIKEDSRLINFYANSFFIEASKQEINTNIKYISYTNYRKNKYRIMTIIKKDKVEKRAVTKEAREHIENMKKNMEKLKLYNIKVLEEGKEDYVQSNFVNDTKRYDLLIDECRNIDEAIEKLKPYIEKLYENSIEYEKVKKEELNEVLKKCDEDLLKKFKYLEYGFMDFIPKNIFYMENELYAFDQEWIEKYIPVEHILYRAIINSNLYTKFQDNILKKLNLIEYRDLFNNIEGEFGKKIIDSTMLDKVFNRKTINKNDLLKEIEDKNETINKQREEFNQQLEKIIKEKEENNKKVKEKEEIIEMLNNHIRNIENSKSWKITKPFRDITRILNNGGNK